MLNNYESRRIENTKIAGGVVDTCAVYDSRKPYETGISHPLYKDGDWIIVECYDTKELAEQGHKKWVDLFSKPELPEELEDVNECEIGDLLEEIGLSTRNKYKRC